ncbi:MAG: GntR family transcriptional regulator [Pseudomonadota bacterium]
MTLPSAETIAPQAPQTRVDHAYQEIKRRVLNNAFPPGYQALENEVAEMLGMSRTPVREALIRLENEGLVELIPRRGMRVVPLDTNDMNEIYSVLSALECEAVDLLASKAPSKAVLAPLYAAMDEMDAALKCEDLVAWADADDRYHRALLDLSGNARLARMAASVRDQGHRARAITLKLREKPLRSNAEHRAVLEAIANGDAESAFTLHREHRKRTSQTLLELLNKYQLPQL